MFGAFTVGLKKDGSCVAIGENNYGQCNVQGWKDIVQIACGVFHTIGLKKDGTCVSCGYNDGRKYNIESWQNIVQVSCGYTHTVGLKKDGSCVAVCEVNRGQCNISDWKDIVQIACGDYHTIGLKKDGTCIAVGDNGNGQSNISDWSNIVQVAGGYEYTIGLKKDGTCVAIGRNDEGQCNISDWKDIVQISCGDYHTIGLKKDGTCVSCGSNDCNQCNISDWKDIVQVSCGKHHTVGLKKDGSCVAVGRNDEGQCNVEDWKDIKYLMFDFIVELKKYKYILKHKGKYFTIKENKIIDVTTNHESVLIKPSDISKIEKTGGTVDIYGDLKNILDGDMSTKLSTDYGITWNKGFNRTCLIVIKIYFKKEVFIKDFKIEGSTSTNTLNPDLNVSLYDAKNEYIDRIDSDDFLNKIEINKSCNSIEVDITTNDKEVSYNAIINEILINVQSGKDTKQFYVENGFEDIDLKLIKDYFKDDDVKLLVFTEDSDMKGIANYQLVTPFRPIDKLKLIGDGQFDILMKEISKTDIEKFNNSKKILINKEMCETSYGTYSNEEYYSIDYLFDNTPDGHYWLSGTKYIDGDFHNKNGNLLIDLKQEYDINNIKVYPYCREDTYSNYSISISNNNKDFKQIVEMTTSKKQKNEFNNHIINEKVRYVKFNFNTIGTFGDCLNEIEIFKK